jgi:hypothetical protein
MTPSLSLFRNVLEFDFGAKMKCYSTEFTRAMFIREFRFIVPVPNEISTKHINGMTNLT